jgi:hypothetical protein
MREIIPEPVYESIARHLRNAGRQAQKSWEVNRAAEDALTGAAFAEFTTIEPDITALLVANGGGGSRRTSLLAVVRIPRKRIQGPMES